MWAAICSSLLSHTNAMHDLALSLPPTKRVFVEPKGCLGSGGNWFWTAKPCRIDDTVCVQLWREIVVSVLVRECLLKGCPSDRPSFEGPPEGLSGSPSEFRRSSRRGGREHARGA